MPEEGVEWAAQYKKAPAYNTHAIPFAHSQTKKPVNMSVLETGVPPGCVNVSRLLCVVCVVGCVGVSVCRALFFPSPLHAQQQNTSYFTYHTQHARTHSSVNDMLQKKIFTYPRSKPTSITYLFGAGETQVFIHGYEVMSQLPSSAKCTLNGEAQQFF